MKRSILTGILLWSTMLHGAVIPTNLAVKAILGEGASEAFQAKLAIACAIRNRGSLRGVYGVTNEIPQHCSAQVRNDALQAWRESANADITHGCRFFGCPTDAPYFTGRLHLHPVLKIGAITFYKP